MTAGTTAAARSRKPAQPQGVRTFDALPPAKGSRAPFAESWWGRAWLQALEGSSLDSGRLQRGRTYARRGAVGQVSIVPGSATAPVQGSRRTPYRSTVRVRQLTDAQWDRLLDVIAERAAGIAALLDSEMPAGLAETPRPRASRCCQAPATSTRSADARTGATPASTPPPSATRSPGCWTATRSCCCSCAAAVNAN